MALSEQDREWVDDKVALAIEKVTTACCQYTRDELGAHSGKCPNVRNLKMLAIGAGVGLLLGGGVSGFELAKLLLAH